MPLYDYRCPSGHATERQIGLADFDATARVPCGCGGCPETAERVIATAPRWVGAAAVANGAMAGDGFTGRETLAPGVARQMRERLDAGTLPGGLHANKGLGYLRAHEMACAAGMPAEARSIERGMAAIMEDADRIARNEPETIGVHRGRRIVKRMETRRGPDGSRELHARIEAA